MPVEDTIDIIDYIPSEVNGVLLSPKLEDDESTFRAREDSSYLNESQITTTDDTIKEKIIDSVLSILQKKLN